MRDRNVNMLVDFPPLRDYKFWGTWNVQLQLEAVVAKQRRDFGRNNLLSWLLWHESSLITELNIQLSIQLEV